MYSRLVDHFPPPLPVALPYIHYKHQNPARQAVDLQSVALGENGTGVFVQDTDLSFRPRVTYTPWREEGSGRWEVRPGNVFQAVKEWASYVAGVQE